MTARTPRPAAGCTLIETLIIVALLAILNVISCVLVLQSLRRAQVARTRHALHVAETAVRTWQAETGRSCPPGLQALGAARLLDRPPQDAWGRPLRIAACSGRQVWLYSPGRDGLAHTEDDVLSWAAADRAWSPPPPPAPPRRWPRALLVLGLLALALRRALRLSPAPAPA